MKCSESWLHEWVKLDELNSPLTREELCHKLTMAGLEVEELAPVAHKFIGVVIGKILKAEKHPEADKLQICEVDIGKESPLQIVCGAANARVGLKVAVATVGAELPNHFVIKQTSIRGVSSSGMLCSASELGLAEESQGILELATDAPIAKELWSYLQLEDYTIDISITPNRGDCLSVKGIAREISTLTGAPLHEVSCHEVKAVNKDKLSVTVEDKVGCPRYVGRVVRNVKADASTPTWLKERLRRSGVRSISPIVDVTNYVMLELGQPMHAFDLNTIKKNIIVRQSKQGEKIDLLDGSSQTLDGETLVIADNEKPLAIAGVMGGLDSSVTLNTTDIFLESAYFSPKIIARQRQFYNLNSDSSYRFERGIDPTIQRQAIERATQLILEIAGGEPGEVIEEKSIEYLSKEMIIALPAKKITQILGIDISESEIEKIFAALKFKYKKERENWLVTVPPYRSDMVLSEDVVEEIARIYGYDKIPTHSFKGELYVKKQIEESHDWYDLRQTLKDQGFNEIISYSFVDKQLQALLDPQQAPRQLINPITADMTVMRTNLWPGFINTLLYNKSRQQHRVRLFEIGTCFTVRGDKLEQLTKVGGLLTGLAQAEQWGQVSQETDFYDLKGHLENTLSLFYPMSELDFLPNTHAALHPGQTAGIYHKSRKIGLIGRLHPTIVQKLDLPTNVFVFELDLSMLKQAPLHRFQEISRFPEIRRDLALLVNQTVPSKDIRDTIKTVAGDWLKGVFIFDVYQGKGISSGLKSIALALILQHPTRTLVDDEVAELMNKVINALKGTLGAELRS